MAGRIVLKDAFKGYTLDQDKLVPPEETVRRFRERIRGLDLNILEETVRIDNGRLDIPVFFSICGKDAEETIGTRKQMGKGGTPQQSEASAVMELGERFSFFSFCKDPGNFFVEEYRNLKDRVLPFEAIARSVHDDSHELAGTREVFSRIPLKWTWAYNLTREEEVLIPFDWFYTINEFNGTSAGNCAEEAICQGICEVVERHVSSLVNRDKLRTPEIKIDSITDPMLLEIIRKYRSAGIRLFVSDFSLDTGIPTVGILAYDPATYPDKSEIVWTTGTTPSPQKALGRALTEVAQLAGDFNTGSSYVASGLPKLKGLEEAHSVMQAEGEVDIGELPDISDDNIRVEVENAVSVLSRKGMEVILVDVMHRGLKIPAFYTIIPGAHFRERAAGTSVGMFSAKLIAESGNSERAIEELKHMDKILPDKYYTKFFLGLSHLSNKDPSSALKHFEQALKLEPNDQDIPTIYSYSGICLKELERYQEAIETLERASGYDRERPDIHNTMGFCYFKMRDHEKAIECFREVLRLDPGSAIDYANIASNYRDLGEREKAVHYYRFALELDPTIEFARDNLQILEQDD